MAGQEWRFLDLKLSSYARAALYLPTILTLREKDKIPNTLTFISFEKPAACLFYYNDPDREIDLPFCRDRGIEVARRDTGGAPYWMDPGTLLFVLCFDRRDIDGFPENLPEGYRFLIEASARSLSRRFPIQAAYRPLNDLEVQGRKIAGHTLTFSVACFIVGAVIAALAPSMPWIIAGRFLQGLGAGGFFAIPFVLIATYYPAELKPRAVGLVSAVWGTSAIGGPALGAAILHLGGWRWVFWLNVPFALGILGLGLLAFPKKQVSAPADSLRRINWLGPVLFTASTASGLQALQSHWPWNLGLVILATTLFVIFILHEEGQDFPIIPSDAWYLTKPLGAAFLGMALITTSFGGAETFLPLLLQGLWKATPLQAGLILSIGSVAWSFTSVIAARYSHRPRHMAVQGTLLMSLGIVLLLWTFASSGPLWLIYVGWALAGCGIGQAVPTYNTLAVDIADRYPSGIATGALQLALTWGFAVGPAAVGSAAQLGFGKKLHPSALDLTGFGGTSLEALRSGASLAQGLCLFFVLLGIALALKIPQHRLHAKQPH